MKQQVLNAVKENKIIVIVRGVERDDLLPLATALFEGGIRLLEVTFDAKGVISDAETAQNIELLVKELGDKMFIGAGTVLTKKQVSLTKKAGGSFIISPNVDKSVIKSTKRAGLVSIPGALTPSECQSAVKYGADLVKLFPVTDLGSGYVKAVCAPLSHIKFLAVGGIDQTNISEYLSAGAVGFGIGSNIITKKLIEKGDFEGIENLAKNYVEALNNA